MKKFGITEETRSSGIVTFKLSPEHPFNLATLESVTVDDTEIKKGDKKGETIKTLNFKFKGLDGVSEHNERFFPVDDADAKYDTKVDLFNSKIKHMFECYAEFPKGGIGTKAKNFEEYMEAIANAFNGVTGKDGEEPKPIFKDVAVWVKFNYNNNGLLQLPLPNFIEKATKNGQQWNNPKTLRKGNKDVFSMPSAGGGASGGTTTAPAFDKSQLPDGF